MKEIRRRRALSEPSRTATPGHAGIEHIKRTNVTKARDYAAARGMGLSSSSFSRASFAQCFAFRRRNLRSSSSFVRAAYHLHWRACSKHSAIVSDMGISNHDLRFVPV